MSLNEATYIRRETKRITKLFKETPIKKAFKIRNTIQNIITLYSNTDKYEKWHIPHEMPRLPVKIPRSNR
jgi:hypothetical protein